MDISRIPVELLRIIFAHLSMASLLNVRWVCKGWRALCASGDGPTVRLDGAWLLQCIKPECAPLYMAALAASFGCIVEINLHCVDRKDEILLALRMSIHTGHLARLAVLDLTSNTRSHPMPGNRCLLHVAVHTNLSSLVLHGCTRVTDTGLRTISGLHRLCSLNIANCRRVTDAGLAHVALLTRLTSLDASGTDITDAGLYYICGLPCLTVLSIASCKRVTDTGLHFVCRIVQLKRLVLAGVGALTDAGFVHIADLASLTSLELSHCCGVTAAGLAHISKLPLLQYLDLTGIGDITDTGLQHISKIGSLVELILCFNSITKAGHGHVKHMQMLDMSYCHVAF
jgi:Leucine-rich repeat (LRR) protein